MPAYRIVDVELASAGQSVELSANEDGVCLVARWRGALIGCALQPMLPGTKLSLQQLSEVVEKLFHPAVLERRLLDWMEERDAARRLPLPPLTVAICSRDRAELVTRLLQSLVSHGANCDFPSVDFLVVENAATSPRMREAVARFAGVRYVHEARPGLDFARNTAIAEARGDLIAYLDDDVVIDRNWFHGLASAWRSLPTAGGFTGLVLPYALVTDSQIRFESRGGFGRGFRRVEHVGESYQNRLHPAGPGILGAGCNMAFDIALLRELGGFDEALDTGPPLPGGGDLDISYRVLRSGRAMVYEPQYAVYHEHRETTRQLSRQYWSWGLGMMAFLSKSFRSDPAMRSRHLGMLRWWLLDRVCSIVKCVYRRRWQELQFAVAELSGGLKGLAGEYDRSLSRVRTIRGSSDA